MVEKFGLKSPMHIYGCFDKVISLPINEYWSEDKDIHERSEGDV